MTRGSIARVGERIRARRARGETALVVYLTAGDPSLAETPGLIAAAAAAGADVVELGIPWSDPSADGPVIQRAMARALAGIAHGVVAGTLDVVRRARASCDVPIVLFGYANPLLQYGWVRAAEGAAVAGADGFLVVDLPPEEAGDFDDALAAAGLGRVPLCAPTTSVARARRLCARGAGFVYYVALTGVTGAAHLDAADVAERTRALRPALGDLPLCVGFGVRDAADAARLRPHCDGVVVGSALVQAIEAATTAEDRRAAVTTLVSSLRAALS